MYSIEEKEKLLNHYKNLIKKGWDWNDFVCDHNGKFHNFTKDIQNMHKDLWNKAVKNNN